jgi:hypothetical protein
MKLSYSEVWADTVGMLRENLAIIAALAGVFLFLPTLLTAYLLPPPDQVQDLREFWNLMAEYWTSNWHWFLLAQIVNMVGAISILLLLLGPRGATVGAVIAAALAILPFFFLASLIANLIIGLGLILLIVPGLYLLGRLCLTGASVVAEGHRNPIAAITRSFELSKGNGWAVLGLVLIVGIAGAIVAAVIGMLLGIIFQIVAGDDLAMLLAKIVEALCSAALSALIVVLLAAIYRRLSGRTSTAAVARD